MMKRIFSIEGNSNRDALLLVIRVGIGALMLVHGVPKLQQLLNGQPGTFANVFGLGSELSLALAVLAEVLCSILILLGLGTRAAAIPLIITMVIAVFYIHGADSFSEQEIGLHYLLVYITLMFAGSGKYSADYFIVKRLA